MKKIIDVKVKIKKTDLLQCKSDMLCLGVFSEPKTLSKEIKELDGKIGSSIQKLIKLGDFKGEDQSCAVVYTNNKIPADRVLLVGLGEKKKVTLDTLRKACACAANKAVDMKLKSVALAIHKTAGSKFDAVDMGKVVAEGAYFGAYRYDEYMKSDDVLNSLNVEIVEADPKASAGLSKGIRIGASIGKAQSYGRTVANRPGNVITPPTLAAEAMKMTRGYKSLTCTVFNEKKLKENKMGGILAVGSGSKSESRLIVIKYKPTAAKAQKLPSIALVGKAVTFDSGGISIKPSANMDAMKLDKSGGVAVLATMKAVAELGLPINVCGIIPSAENMPGGSSYRPGDIVTTYSKKTVEILNTDAEGRMILCDALWYADKQKYDVIVDMATLTGSCMVALGKYMAGLFSNDDKLVEQLKKAADDSGERLWHLPCGEDYVKEMKSKIADLKNTGSKWGGASTAAAFLSQFVEKAKWAHLDIAGMDVFESNNKYSSVGSSGFGVRLFVQFLMNMCK